MCLQCKLLHVSSVGCSACDSWRRNDKSCGSRLEREKELLEIKEQHKLEEYLTQLKCQQQQLKERIQHLEQELQMQDAAAGSSADSRCRADLSLEEEVPQVKETGSEQQTVEKQQLEEEKLHPMELQEEKEAGSCDETKHHEEASSLLLNEGNNNVQNIPTTNVKRFDKTIGHANISGQLYEVKVAALLFGRALNRAEDFHLASNMAAAGAFDDIVLRLGQKILFWQLKHRIGKSKMIHMSQLVQLKGDFSLLKYYKSYCEVKQQWAQNKDLRHCGRFEDSAFIVYTNATLATSIADHVGNTDDWYSVLSLGGKCFSFTEQSLFDIYNLFCDLPRCRKLLSEELGSQNHEELLQIVRKLWKNKAKTLPGREELNKMLNELTSIGDVSDHKEFLSWLRFCTGEAAEAQLDDLIMKEIKTSIGKDTVYEKFLTGMQTWWNTSKYFLTETALFLLEICAVIISEPQLKQLENINVSFHRDAVDTLRANLPPVGGFLHIITNGTVGTIALTTLKVHQSLADERHLLVDGNILCAHQRKVLELWGRWCDLLVVVDDGAMLPDFLHPHLDKRLVYISGSATRDTCTTLQDEPDLSQLDDASQTSVSASLVHFQGHDVALREIIGSGQHMVPPDVIVQLMIDKPVLGDNLTYEIDYYVPRTLRHTAQVRDEILSHTTDSPVTFAVSGISHHELQQLVPSERDPHTR